MQTIPLLPQSSIIQRGGKNDLEYPSSFSESNLEEGNNKNTTLGNDSPNLASEGKISSGDTLKDLGARILKLNRKVLEPVLKDLEVANLVFSSVNAATKKGLKEFMFLKQKEQIEREKIRKIMEERNAQLLNEKRNKKRNVKMPSLPTKQEPISVKLESIETPKPKQVDITPEPIPPKPSSVVKKAESQKKGIPTNISNPTRRVIPSKVTNEKTLNEPLNAEKSKVSTQKKKLEDILAMARKIRSKEEEPTKVVKMEQTVNNSEPEQPESEEIEPEEPSIEEPVPLPEEEPKLSFVTIDERFQHYVAILKSFNEANEKAEELGAKLSKKSGWQLSSPKQMHSKKTNNQPRIDMKTKYNSLICKCLKTKSIYNESEVTEFRNRFCYNDEDMQRLEEELLLNSKEKRKPELTSTNIIYSDIPNSYICRWLPKRVNKHTSQTIVPHKDLSNKFDKRRARFPCRLFNFKNKKELKTIYLKRFEVQQLMLKNYLYQNIFKGDINLLNYLPLLKEEGQEEHYYKLLRCLEGIIPCEAYRNENHRNIINWKSIYHFLPNATSNTCTPEDQFLDTDSGDDEDESLT